MLAHLDLSNLTGDGRDNQQIAGGRIPSSELGLPAKIAGSGRERYMSISMGRWKTIWCIRWQPRVHFLERHPASPRAPPSQCHYRLFALFVQAETQPRQSDT
jgi:hypothetical protein